MMVLVSPWKWIRKADRSFAQKHVFGVSGDGMVSVLGQHYRPMG